MNAILVRIGDQVARLPLWARKALVDFVEGFVAALLAFDFAFPTDLASAQRIAVAAGVAAIAALVSALRRNAPAAFAWLEGKLHTSEVKPA